MSVLNWLRSRRGNQPASAEVIRRELTALHQQRRATTQRRDLLALDAVNDERSATRWVDLAGTARQLDDRIAVLDAALPQAEAREAEAARQAEVALRAKHMRDYERQTAEAQAWAEDMLARLPNGEELTQARDLRDALNSKAAQMRAWSKDACVRRPLDPLGVLVTAMEHRIARVARARWIGSAPITLGGPSGEELVAAAARVQTLERTAHD
jgi:hypothetical protein